LTNVWARWVCRFGAATVAFAALGGCAETPNAEAPEATLSDSAFQDDLAPYGRWAYTDAYGWIWLPSADEVGAGFEPYVSGGSWVYTDVGWMFVSDYPWGWATFHYGRWYWTPGYGWAWVPGYVWAPAWVDWRYGAGVVGWAPLPPPGRGSAPWVFTSTRDFGDHHVHAFAQSRTPALIQATTPAHSEARVGGAAWYRGPSPATLGVARGSIAPLHVTPPRPGAIVRTHVSGGVVHYQPMHAGRGGATAAPAYRRGRFGRGRGRPGGGGRVPHGGGGHHR
jgi:Family of unknown function (DUF6600)